MKIEQNTFSLTGNLSNEELSSLINKMLLKGIKFVNNYVNCKEQSKDEKLSFDFFINNNLLMETIESFCKFHTISNVNYLKIEFIDI